MCQGGNGVFSTSCSYAWFFVVCWRFWGGTKGSDEEHITYSGGTKIKDLGQCGWGEKKMKEKEKEKERIKYDESVKY